MEPTEVKQLETGLLGFSKLQDSIQTSPETFPLTEQEKKEFRSIKNPRRKKEYLAIRILLQEMMKEKDEILYNVHGKPRLKKSPLHITISHSSSLAAILLSRNRTGIDVEQRHRKIQNIVHRFLSKDEMHAIHHAEDSQLSGILYWCAKEAAYKYAGRSEIKFKTDIIISPFTPLPGGGKFKGEFRKVSPPVKLTFHYLFFENNVIVYCVEEE